MPGAMRKQSTGSEGRQKARPRAQDFLDEDDSSEISGKAMHAEEPKEIGDEDEQSSDGMEEEQDSTDISSEAGTSDSGSDSEAESEEDEPDTTEQLKSVSFGTLARAQETLGKKRKHEADTAEQPSSDKLGAVRARLQELKRARLDANGDRKAKRSKHNSDTDASTRSESDSDSDSDAKPKARSSKHAPMSQSSRYQVSRKREVVNVPKRHTRDPRFGPVPGSRTTNTHAEKAYDFLQDYAEGEMRELRGAIKRSKSEEDKATLRRKLMSMENRKRARADKELAAQVTREHRRAEQKAVAEGKRPHYLKASEKARLVAVKRFEGLSEGQREKVMEKRRRREAQREKKNMPASRRIAG